MDQKMTNVERANKKLKNDKDKKIKLTICIATFNRGNFIRQTIDSILPQLSQNVELVVVNGASPDDTDTIMAGYARNHPQLRYFHEELNSGIDVDYDKAVSYSRGEYCWLMTDDDLLRPSAVARVLSELDEGHDLIVVNAEVKNADLSVKLTTRQLSQYSDKTYDECSTVEFFSDCINYLSFIGSVVIRRDVWRGRDRESYYGTLFVHVGVIFQSPPISKAHVISEPLIVIRYGNAMWTGRRFEIWNFKWPNLIWSFESFSPHTKLKVCHPAPWGKIKTLLYYRSLGSFTKEEYKKIVAVKALGMQKYGTALVAYTPVSVAMTFATLYLSVFRKSRELQRYDLLHSHNSNKLSRFLARILW